MRYYTRCKTYISYIRHYTLSHDADTTARISELISDISEENRPFLEDVLHRSGTRNWLDYVLERRFILKRMGYDISPLLLCALLTIQQRNVKEARKPLPQFLHASSKSHKYGVYSPLYLYQRLCLPNQFSKRLYKKYDAFEEVILNSCLVPASSQFTKKTHPYTKHDDIHEIKSNKSTHLPSYLVMNKFVSSTFSRTSEKSKKTACQDFFIDNCVSVFITIRFQGT